MDIRNVRLTDLSDEELNALTLVVMEEREKRAVAKMQRGDLPEPSEAERRIWANNGRFEAIKAYRNRCIDAGLTVSILEAKKVLGMREMTPKRIDEAKVGELVDTRDIPPTTIRRGYGEVRTFDGKRVLSITRIHDGLDWTVTDVSDVPEDV